VIRFATGDKARYMPHGDCVCGRAWDGIEAGSVGRYDDMLKIRGNNVWPVAVDAAVFANPEIAEFAGRVYVDERGRTGAQVRLALKPEYAKADAETRAAVLARVRDDIKVKTNVTMEVVEVPRDELPTFTYKARRWVDARREGYDRTVRAAQRETAKEVGDHDRKR
jgi:phenylacetate-CoA ligase